MFTDNSRYPQLLINKDWVEKLQKDKIPNIANLINAQKSPTVRPRPQLQPAVAVRA